MIEFMAKEERARHSDEGGTRKVFADEAGRWGAVVDRNQMADGYFFYSVRTTGVYCRPSCPSRRARREHVRFHRTTAEAERAGFRPCKRCRPDEPALAERRAALVEAACRTIERAAQPPTLGALAEAAAVSRFHFHRVFTSLTGVSPRQYAAAHRTRRVRDGLAQRGTVTEAIYGAGFNSSGRFYASASGALGMTPTRFRAGGAGMSMRFAVGQCWLGAVLVAATETGVCAVFLGDDPDALVQELQDRFPKALLVGGDRDFEGHMAKVIGSVEAPGQGLHLPMDIRGTAFQQRVWQALRDIPAGATASYTDIARRIGAPKAVRAVAGACGANPIAVAIPCHRVVRRDGALSGYRWGIERKRALLQREAIR